MMGEGRSQERILMREAITVALDSLKDALLKAKAIV